MRTLSLPNKYVSITPSRAFLVATPTITALLITAGFISLVQGSTAVSPSDLFESIFFSPHQQGDAAKAISILRVPRVSLAILAGALLALSGYLLQIVSRNGLADPGILGLSDGATVAVICVTFLWPSIASTMSSLLSFAGALSVAVVVVGLGRRLLSGGGIILVGLALNIVLGSIVEIFLASGSATQFAQLLTWSRGTLNTVDGDDLRVVFFWFIVIIPVVFLLSRRFGPMLLGADEALATGVAIRQTNMLLILLAAATAAPVVATCGPIAFIGLMAAHIARAIVGDRPTEVLILSMLAGALILLAADTLGRTLFAPLIVSAGVMVSVAGVLAFFAVAGLKAARNRT
ncbi:FecCD family ABC transporter permease [Brucellaceae bacterium D45D]